MEGPVISIDISDGSSHFRCFYEQNKEYGTIRRINHDIEGFEFLLTKLRELEKRTEKEVCVVYEATGVYSRPVVRFLEKNNIKHYMISPLQSAKQRQKKIHGKKHDKIDPKTIAEVYCQEELHQCMVEEDIYHQLRVTNRNYEDSLDHLRKYKVSFQNALSIVFPGYKKLFDNCYSDISLAILKKYPHLDMIKNKKPETVARYLVKHINHKEKACLKWANKVIDLANRTYPECDKDDIEVFELLRLLVEVEKTSEACESQLKEMITTTMEMPNYLLILGIPGIGPNLSCRILAEIGDITRFKNARSLVSYTGFDPNIYQSGQINGEHLSITKKGNKRLRCLLYQAAGYHLKYSNDKDAVKKFYQKKTQQSVPLKPKAARIACAAKLLRIIYGMCNNNTVYQN